MKSLNGTKKAIIIFQYVERIKSELIIGSKLLEELQNMEESDCVGAERVLLFYLDMVRAEIEIAQQVSGLPKFADVQASVDLAFRSVKSHEYLEAIKHISQAISLATTSRQDSAQQLHDKGLI